MGNYQELKRMGTANSAGFVIVAQNSSDINYAEQAYALALSISNTQTYTKKVTLITDGATKNSMSVKQKGIFDRIIVLDVDKAAESSWKIENRYRVFELSPYDRTAVMDADMLVFRDHREWWDITHPVAYCETALRYDGTVATSDFYRKTFTSNGLPNFYSALFMFDKSTQAEQFFNDVKYICENWQTVYTEILDKTRPSQLSMDVAYAIAAKINSDSAFSDTRLAIVHAKTNTLRHIESINDNWEEYISTHFTDDCSLYLNNYLTYVPFHYHKKTWLSKDIIGQLEHYAKHLHIIR